MGMEGNMAGNIRYCITTNYVQVIGIPWASVSITARWIQTHTRRIPWYDLLENAFKLSFRRQIPSTAMTRTS